MHREARLTRVVLACYFAGSVIIAAALAFGVGRAGNLAGTTSGRVLAAAVLSLGIGALLAARDPFRDRAVIRVLIVFTSLSALAIAYRLFAERSTHPHDPAWLVLPFAVAAPLLLALSYPRAPQS